MTSYEKLELLKDYLSEDTILDHFTAWLSDSTLNDILDDLATDYDIEF